MKYLHVGILEDYGECLVADSEEELRKQVEVALAKVPLPPLTDAEWAECVKDEVCDDPTTDCLAISLITYYKIESKLEEMSTVNGR